MFKTQRRFVWSDVWYIHVKGSDDFHTITFDLINVILKWFFRLEFCCFNSVFTLICSDLLSKDTGIFERCLSCRIKCDEILNDVSLRILVASERNSIYVLRGNSSFSICFDSWCCFTLKYISCYCCCSKIWSYLSGLDWILVSKLSSEDGCSEVRLSTSFSMCYDENMFNYMYYLPLNSTNYS